LHGVLGSPKKVKKSFQNAKDKDLGPKTGLTAGLNPLLPLTLCQVDFACILGYFFGVFLTESFFANPPRKNLKKKHQNRCIMSKRYVSFPAIFTDPTLFSKNLLTAGLEHLKSITLKNPISRVFFLNNA